MLLGASILGVGGDEAIHSLLTCMYAKQPVDLIAQAVFIHPTVSELIPTMLQEMKPLESSLFRPQVIASAVFCVDEKSKTLAFSSTSPPHTPHGSTRSSCGSARSSVTSLLVASSPLSLTWPARSNDTSRLTRPTPSRFTGSTQTPNAASAVTISLRQSTRDNSDLLRYARVPVTSTRFR
jgi:hypothetical protein